MDPFYELFLIGNIISFCLSETTQKGWVVSVLNVYRNKIILFDYQKRLKRVGSFLCYMFTEQNISFCLSGTTQTAWVISVLNVYWNKISVSIYQKRIKQVGLFLCYTFTETKYLFLFIRNNSKHLRYILLRIDQLTADTWTILLHSLLFKVGSNVISFFVCWQAISIFW